MMTRDLLAALLPAPAYDPTQANLNAWLTAMAIRLDAVTESATAMLDSMLLNDTALLASFERVYGLSAGSYSDFDRLIQIRAALVRTGGLSRAYFIKLAKALGYEIEIREPVPVPLGVLRVGGELTNLDRWWTWLVVVKSYTKPFTCVSECDDALVGLAVESAPELETLIVELKPAHTHVRFIYEAK